MKSSTLGMSLTNGGDTKADDSVKVWIQGAQKKVVWVVGWLHVVVVAVNVNVVVYLVVVYLVVVCCFCCLLLNVLFVVVFVKSFLCLLLLLRRCLLSLDREDSGG